MMTSILSPVEMDYDIAIIQDMEMVRGEAHSTGSLDICLYSQVCSRPPVNRIPGRNLPKKDAMMSKASPRPGLMTLLKTIEGRTRHYRSHGALIFVYNCDASPCSNQYHLGLNPH